MNRATFVIKTSRKAKMVFHNVPVNAKAFFNFRDGVIMETYAKNHQKGNISFVNFEDVSNIYKNVSVLEMIGA